MKPLLSFLVCCIVLCACDIPGRLVIVNKTDHQVTVDVGEFREGRNTMSYPMDSIVVPASSKRFISYGFGGFYDSEADSLNKALKSISVQTDSGVYQISDRRCLEQVLPSKVTGVLNSVLQVKIKKSFPACDEQ